MCTVGCPKLDTENPHNIIPTVVVPQAVFENKL